MGGDGILSEPQMGADVWMTQMVGAFGFCILMGGGTIAVGGLRLLRCARHDREVRFCLMFPPFALLTPLQDVGRVGIVSRGDAPGF